VEFREINHGITEFQKSQNLQITEISKRREIRFLYRGRAKEFLPAKYFLGFIWVKNPFYTRAEKKPFLPDPPFSAATSWSETSN